MEYKEFREFWDKAAIYYNQQHGKTCDGCGLLCSSGGCLLSYPYDVTETQFNFVQNYDFTDWSKVPIDAKILVWGEDGKKENRHFCKRMGDKILAWPVGKTSFTATGLSAEVWEHAELYKEEA